MLEELIVHGARASVVCFTHGEASTLQGSPGQLVVIRSRELNDASATLGLSRVELHDYPDGNLAAVPLDELGDHILRLISEERPSLLLVFDLGGLPGTPTTTTPPRPPWPPQAQPACRSWPGQCPGRSRSSSMSNSVRPSTDATRPNCT